MDSETKSLIKPAINTVLLSSYTRQKTAKLSKIYGLVNYLFQWLSILIILGATVVAAMLLLSPDFTSLWGVCTFLIVLLSLWGMSSLFKRFLNGQRSGV